MSAPLQSFNALRLWLINHSGGSIALTHPLGMSEHLNQSELLRNWLTAACCSRYPPGRRWSRRAASEERPSTLHEYVYRERHGRCSDLRERGTPLERCIHCSRSIHPHDVFVHQSIAMLRELQLRLCHDPVPLQCRVNDLSHSENSFFLQCLPHQLQTDGSLFEGLWVIWSSNNFQHPHA